MALVVQRERRYATRHSTTAGHHWHCSASRPGQLFPHDGYHLIVTFSRLKMCGHRQCRNTARPAWSVCVGELTDCLALPEGPSSTRPPWDGGTAACHLGSHMSCLDPFITPKISEGDARAVLPSASSQTVGREFHQYPGDRVLTDKLLGGSSWLFFFLNKKLNFKKYFSRMITIKLWSPLLPLESKRVKEEKKKRDFLVLVPHIRTRLWHCPFGLYTEVTRGNHSKLVFYLLQKCC